MWAIGLNLHRHDISSDNSISKLNPGDLVRTWARFEGRKQSDLHGRTYLVFRAAFYRVVYTLYRSVPRSPLPDNPT